MIEQEIKSIITEFLLFKYKNILDGLTEHSRILQINYYYDTDDFQLNSIGNTLRIRQKENKLVLQYKYEKQYTGNERTCREYEIEIYKFPQYLSSNDLPCNIIDSTHYKFVGSLITERFDYKYAETNISLDKSYYLGKCDYEIEIEFQDYKKAESILKLLSIEKSEFHEMGKYSRFVKEIKKLENK